MEHLFSRHALDEHASPSVELASQELDFLGREARVREPVEAPLHLIIVALLVTEPPGPPPVPRHVDPR
eukprot:CAMPEP_0206282340 /NCGR_PEP_ID=MMETSP0047_2-20121206/39634_1 /ASSEMBLY_ACC=CAM_ASM_000192 /TAXON_ID=195065 /ORGANISM="Chroomonas mesostigmatica_cf, Strain CCMP1168" /LENGTH=67 /DNA_ID=CAMNT_0053712611 /DNA_START=344 /DNA_END=543 /DNA_ORIENTATION=-